VRNGTITPHQKANNNKKYTAALLTPFIRHSQRRHLVKVQVYTEGSGDGEQPEERFVDSSSVHPCIKCMVNGQCLASWHGEKREMEINGKMIGSCDDDDVVDTNVTYL